MYGEKIKSKRKAMGLSQEVLAEKLRVTRQAVSKWEMDRAQPTTSNLRELAQVFSVDMAYFIGKDEKEEAENTSPVKNLLWWILNCGIGFVYFLFYYYVFVETLFHGDPKAMPFLPLTIYMLVATVAFPQAVKDTGDRLDHVDYNFFRLVALPALYIIGPVVVLYGSIISIGE